MPAIGADLGATAGDVKLTMTGYFLGFALAQLVCGPLSDAFGRRPILIAFMALYAGGSLACSLAGSIETLIAARVLQGIGAAAGIALTRAMVRDGFVGNESARLLNLIGICLAIGPAISPTIGAGLLYVADWHAIFLLMVVLGVGLTALSVASVPETARQLMPAKARPSAVLASFGHVLSHAGFWKAALIVGMALGGLYAFASILPFALIDTFGLSPAQFALAMLLQTGAYLGTALVLRRVLTVVPELMVAVAGVVLVGIASLMVLSLVWFGDRLWLVLAPIPVWAAGIGMLMPGATTAAMAPFPRNAGAASALLGFFQVGGGLLGSFAAAFFTDHVLALATVIPLMGAICVLALALPWREDQRAPVETPSAGAAALDSGECRT
jgi:DHA1 family bicyclomycin/chloramphenicol resistance-like MFS transporter